MNEDIASLQERIRVLEKHLEERNRVISVLERANKELEQRLKAHEVEVKPAPLTELEETLRRFVSKIAAILQADMCVFMLHNPRNGRLEGAEPAFGITDEQLDKLAVPGEIGIAGEVFRDLKPVIIYDAASDPRTVKDQVELLRIRNGVCVPLIIEKRNEQTNELLESKPIGVLMVFNKRYGGVFIQEDVSLLTRLAKNAASVIVSAQMYREVVKEREQVEKMKTAFVSTVSHELRTPLTSIKGFICTLLDDEGAFDADTRRDFYNIINEECDRLVRLISDLLDVSRIEAGRALDLKWKPVDLRMLIERVIIVQSSFTTKHSFESVIDPDLPQVVADEDKVEQILTNLVSNAIKYSPGGGTITVKASPSENGAVLSITDQGIGIPVEHVERIFDWFHRVDNRDTREVGGTGIGLYLVKHLVDAHGGNVRVESEPGVGSTFSFELPKVPPQIQQDRQEQQAAQAK